MTKVNELGQQILQAKYYAPGETTPEDVFMRVAKAVAIPDVFDIIFGADYRVSDPYESFSVFKGYEEAAVRAYERRYGVDARVGTTIINKEIVEIWDKEAKKYFDAMANLDFMPATPILINAGRQAGMLSSCFFLRIPDTMEGIFDTVKNSALIAKLGGGTGLDVSELRPEGAPIKGTNGTSSGPISFLKIFNETGNQVVAGGVRRSAQIAIMRVDHPDIFKFIRCKEVEGALSNFNMSVIVSDAFMKAVKDDGEIELWHKAVSERKKVKAREIWNLLVEKSWTNGEPGILFDDALQSGDVFNGKFGKMGVNPCVTGDTLLLTDNGYFPIKDLVGKKVNAWNGFEWSEVEPKITGENQDIIDVHISDGTIISCTPYHKFILADGTKVEAKTLNIGDKLVKQTYPIIKGNSSCCNEQYKYTQGFYSGDGFYDNTNNKSKITLYHEKIKVLDHLLYTKATTDPARNRMFVNLPENIIWDKLYVPESNTSINEKLEWLAGLLDSDGCKNSSEGSLSISSVDRDFLYNVKLMLSTLGIWSTVGIMKHAEIKKMPNGKGGLADYPCQTCYRIVISSANLEKLLKLGLKTYRVELKCNPNRDASRFPTVIGLEYRDKKEEFVYCATEPKRNTLCFSGILTGNCGEISLIEYESCTLAAINLGNCFTNGKTDFDKIQKLTELGINFLDNIVDLNKYPIPEIEHWTLRTRRVGLGIMGLHDLMLKNKIKYGAQESIDLIHNVYRFMWDSATKTSIELANVRGIPKDLKDVGLPRRNAGLLSIQPTGTISIICNQASSGIEPVFQWEYTRKDTFGTHRMKHFILEENNDKLPDYAVTALDVSPEAHVKIQSIAQQYVDNSISKTINLPNSATKEDVDKLLKLAHELGCKSTTVYRSGSRVTEVLVKDKKEEKPVEVPKPIEPVVTKAVAEDLVEEDEEPSNISPSRERPRVLFGATYRYNTSGGKLYVTISEDHKGVREVFINVSKAGSEVKSHVEVTGRLISNSLKYGIPIDVIISHLKGQKSSPTIDNGRWVLSVPDAVAQALIEYRKDFEGFSLFVEDPLNRKIECSEQEEHKEDIAAEISGELCVECGENMAIRVSGCLVCKNCGYERCGG